MAKSFQEQIDAIMKRQSTSGKGIPLSSAGKRNLKREADILKSFIQRQILAYYDSYKPTRYTRKYCFRNSIESPRIVGDEAIISFDSAMARHPSLFAGGSGDVPSLINYGWSWKNRKPRVYHFTYYPGFHFLEKAIAGYLATGPKAMTIEVHDTVGNVRAYGHDHMPMAK